MGGSWRSARSPPRRRPSRAFARSPASPSASCTPPPTCPRASAAPRIRSGCPAQYPFTRGIHESMYRGRLWTMRQFAGFGTSEETNERFHYLLEHGQTGLSTAFDMPSLMGHDSDHARSLGEVGREGVAIDTLDDMRTLFSGIDLGEVSVSMTINAPAAIMLAFYVAAAEADPPGRAGRSPPERLSGTIQADILKEYIAQKEWCFPIDPAMRLCGDMIEWCTPRHAALAPDLDLRLPHPRGRLDRPAGARVHAQGRPHLRRAGGRTRPRRRRLRAAAVVLLQRPDRLLRGDRQVPRRAAHLGAGAARDVRRQEPALLADALSHPDRRRQPDRAAAAQQHRAHRHRGARRRARRHPVAAHQLLRRGARAAHRGGRHDRAAHPAGDRPRDRRHQHRRPARRLLLRRGAHRRDGASAATSTSPRSIELGGMVEAVKRNYPQREIADAAFELQQEIDARRADRRRRQPLRARRRAADPHPARRPGARAQADRPPAGRARQARRRGGGARSRGPARGRRRTRSAT